MDWNDTSSTIIGQTDIQCGALSISDVRLGCKPRSGTYGVQDWNSTSKTVIGAGDIHAGTSAVADPRIPKENERCLLIIISEDGTWHRPLTTYELAMLQGFSRFLLDGNPFQLVNCSDAKAREYIGNAVPPAAAEAIAQVMLIALMSSSIGYFMMSHDEVWVLPDHVNTEKVELTH